MDQKKISSYLSINDFGKSKKICRNVSVEYVWSFIFCVEDTAIQSNSFLGEMIIIHIKKNNF